VYAGKEDHARPSPVQGPFAALCGYDGPSGRLISHVDCMNYQFDHVRILIMQRGKFVVENLIKSNQHLLQLK
jgi:hypothetical protein